MIDVLYIVKADSGHGNRELRWSLRSLAKYGRNLGRVVVVGNPPNWLSHHVDAFVVPTNAQCKYRRIMDCALRAIDIGAVHGEFLYSSDDHFLSRETDLEATGFYKKRDAIQTEAEHAATPGGDKFKAYHCMMTSTRDCLLHFGYPIVESCCHANTRLDTADAETVRCLYKNNPSKYADRGMELTCTFQNVRACREGWDASHFVKRPDSKMSSWNDAEVRQLGFFSISDKIFSDPAFIAYMDREFGEPCKYERAF